MIPRPDPIDQIITAFQVHPVTALLGPRQCGKTTLARIIAEQEPATIFDLENPVDMRRLSVPMQTLKDLSGLVILDEVQRKPELFQLLRVLVDRPGQNTRFLVLGLASPHFVRFLKEIYHSWVFRFPRKRFADSGPWWPTFTGRFGTRRSSPDPWVLRKTQCVDISTFFPVLTWCGCCRPGLKI
jgi:hypothetical protein